MGSEDFQELIGDKDSKVEEQPAAPVVVTQTKIKVKPPEEVLIYAT